MNVSQFFLFSALYFLHPFRFRKQRSNFILLVIFKITLLPVVFSQLESGFTEANECRHVAILSRNGNTTHTTACFIPTQTASFSGFTLKDSIPDEWKWVLNNSFTVSGQIITYRKNSVSLLTQKECLDAGLGVGRQGRNVYADVKSDENILYSANYDKEGGTGDAYKDCAFGTTPWQENQIRNSTSNNTMNLPSNVIQVVRSHSGQHLGTGDFLIPFEFSYSPEHLENDFREGLRLVRKTQVTREEPQPTEFRRIESRKPILRSTYPFESGLSILALDNSNLKKGTRVKDINRDLSVTAWNRLLEAVTSSSSQFSAPVEKPQTIRQEALLSLVVVTVLSIMVSRAIFAKLSSAREEVVRQWPKSSGQEPWVAIKSRKEHDQWSRYHHRVNRESLEAFTAYFGAVIAVAAAIIEFRNSDLRPQLFVTVHQGGLVTYGQREFSLSDDPHGNELSGTPFVIGHWTIVQIELIGSYTAFCFIVLFYTALFLSLLSILYIFSCQKENRLYSSCVWILLKIIRVPTQSLLHLLSLIPAIGGIKLFRNYNLTVEYFINLICKAYQVGKFESVGNCKIDGQIQMKCRESYDADAADAVNNHDNKPTDDDIEKAAIILASVMYGRLTYAQALALTADANLTHAVNICTRTSFDHVPMMDEIRRLAALYYVNSVIVPGLDRTSVPSTSRRQQDDLIPLDLNEHWNDGNPDFKVWGGDDSPAFSTNRRRLAVVLGADAWPNLGEAFENNTNAVYVLDSHQ